MASRTKKPAAATQKRQAAHREDTATLRAVIDHVLDGIITMTADRTVNSFNSAAERIFGYDAAEVIGKNVKMLMPEPYHGEHDGYVESYLETGEAKIIGIGREVTGRRKDGSTMPIDLAVTEMRVGRRRMFVGILRDITERKEAEATIAAQSRAIMELSTPVLKVWDEVVLLPLIGSIDSHRANQIIENLLDAIVRTEARVAVIDVTGVPVIDTFVGKHLLKTVAAAEMLGAKVLLTGVSPEIAQTLIKAGVDLSMVRTCGPLRVGVAEALRLIGRSPHEAGDGSAAAG